MSGVKFGKRRWLLPRIVAGATGYLVYSHGKLLTPQPVTLIELEQIKRDLPYAPLLDIFSVHVMEVPATPSE